MSQSLALDQKFFILRILGVEKNVLVPIIFIFGFIIYSIGSAQDIFSPFAGDFFITSENQTIPVQPPVAERVEKRGTRHNFPD